MSLPGKHHFVAYIGATFATMVEWRNGAGETIDLNDYTARMQIRKTEGSVLVLTLDSEADGISIETDGRARLSIADEITATIIPGTYKYDLLLTALDSDEVTPLLKGHIQFRRLVTTEGS